MLASAESTKKGSTIVMASAMVLSGVDGSNRDLQGGVFGCVCMNTVKLCWRWTRPAASSDG